jgi:outer membrane protein OmpA-like peptidoglycan-associated protein
MTRLNIRLGALVICAACGSSHPKTVQTASTADFVSAAPQVHIQRSLVASPDARNRIEPTAVVAFEFDSARLSDASYSEVDTAAHWLMVHPSYRLVLEGHTDALGVAPYNEDLSTRRMESVRKRMLQDGIPSDRIMMITYGENEAMDLNNPLYPADRHVTMYASRLDAQTIVAMVRANRPAIVATWTDRGALMRVEHGLSTPTKTITVRR